MKKFKIPVEWAVCAMVEIEAETLGEAVKIFDKTIDDIPLPTDTEYIDDSFMRAEQDGNTLEYYKIFNYRKVEKFMSRRFGVEASCGMRIYEDEEFVCPYLLQQRFIECYERGKHGYGSCQINLQFVTNICLCAPDAFFDRQNAE